MSFALWERDIPGTGFQSRESNEKRINPADALPREEGVLKSAMACYVASESTRAGLQAAFNAYFSGGASGEDPPRKIFRPSGNVMSRPLALFDPSLAR